MSFPTRYRRQCDSGAWGPFCLPGAWHQELLPGQCGLLLHAAGGQRRQREVMVPVTHVVHVHHLWADRLHAAAQAGDGHPAVIGNALPWRRIRSPWRLSWRLSSWLLLLKEEQKKKRLVAINMDAARLSYILWIFIKIALWFYSVSLFLFVRPLSLFCIVFFWVTWPLIISVIKNDNIE